MIKLITIFILALSISSIHSRLVFKPGSDVGYILPDSLPDETYQYDNAKKYLEENEIKNEVKRAFWNTLYDDISELSLTGQEKNSDRSSNRRSSDPQKEQKVFIPENLRDAKHGVAMGISDNRCDDAKTHLEVDWNGSPGNYTCFTPKRRLVIRSDVAPVETCDYVPPHYSPKHYCMNYSIVYNTTIPTTGSHRPLWAVFGEYEFLPPQRWLHNIEHGSVVMLYHPCTEPLLVLQLKQLVKKCIYKHVISPSNQVTIEKPLVLVAWGCKLEMSEVNEEKVVTFIRTRALHGPEGTLSKQGTYTQGLIHKSIPPSGSDINDTNLCPTY